MTARTRTGPLLRALRALHPESEISIIHERPWHSLTYSGTQMCFSVKIACLPAENCAAHFSDMMTEHEFDLPGQIVADIAVTRAVVAAAMHCLIVDALVLDD